MEHADDLSSFRKYDKLAGDLMAHSSPQELAECARLLALNAAQARSGSASFQQLAATLDAACHDDRQIKLMAEAMRTLVAVLALVRKADKNPEPDTACEVQAA